MSTFLQSAPLINLSILGMLGMEPGPAESGSKYANHCAMQPRSNHLNLNTFVPKLFVAELVFPILGTKQLESYLFSLSLGAWKNLAAAFLHWSDFVKRTRNWTRQKLWNCLALSLVFISLPLSLPLFPLSLCLSLHLSPSLSLPLSNADTVLTHTHTHTHSLSLYLFLCWTRSSGFRSKKREPLVSILFLWTNIFSSFSFVVSKSMFNILNLTGLPLNLRGRVGFSKQRIRRESYVQDKFVLSCSVKRFAQISSQQI